VRSVLITGGSGSFGRAFVRRLLSSSVDRICIYSRGEHAQASMRAEFGNDSRLRWMIGDVRDQDRLRRAMRGVDTVIHAAALKRIEVGQENPSEMARTNVEGAMNVIAAASKEAVEKIVALSTDKAYQPISPYGQTKALAESLFLAANREYGWPKCSVTRYGNVAGSAGSVIPVWRAAIAAGAEPKITDPDCTRFWMTMDEAVSLVSDTARTMRGGELAIPVLPAYRLGDLAEAIGARSFISVGLPSWEKKHEGMSDELRSDTARRMSVDELKEALTHV
jgi:UDP-N-acetylglucosamine 4,6-dehydratase/5-epimerase